MTEPLLTVTLAYLAFVLLASLAALAFHLRAPKRFHLVEKRLMPAIYRLGRTLCSAGILASIGVFASCFSSAFPSGPAGALNIVYTQGAVMTGELFVIGLVVLFLLPRVEDAIWGVPKKGPRSDACRRSPIRPYVLLPVFFLVLYVPVCVVTTVNQVLERAAAHHMVVALGDAHRPVDD